jgi:hypothetical protein
MIDQTTPSATVSGSSLIAARPVRHLRRRARTVALRLALLLLSLLLPLLALELALRWFGPILPGNYSTGYYLTTDPVYGRFHVRDFSGWTRTPEYTTFFRTNGLGLRGAPLSATPAPGVNRILVTGDSFVEAAQVREEESFTQRLGRSMEGVDGKRYEVLNAGIGGWGTGQELLYLRNEGLALRPTLVLLVLYVGNDIVNNSATLERQDGLEIPFKPYWELDGADGLRQLPHQERPADPDDWALQIGRRSSALFNFVESGFFDKFKYRDLDLVGNQSDVGKPVLRARYTPEWEQSWQITERLLAQAAATAAQAGVSFVVVAAPSTFQVIPDDWRQLVRESRRPQSDWDQDKPSQRLAEIAARRGLTLIDLLPALRAARDNGAAPLYFDRDKHWTPAGHEVVAQAIEARLRELGLIAHR